MTKDQQIYNLMEELFDAKLKPIDDNLTNINKILNGNGKPGLVADVVLLKANQKDILAKFALFSAFFGLVFLAVFEGVKRLFFKSLGI